jgi:hypothetical protein
MDGLSFAAPARVRTLVVPVGHLERAHFNGYAEQLRGSAEVRLVDVTRTRTQMFNPQRFPNGRVVYDITTSLDSQESLFLHDFEPFRKTFVVVGVTGDASGADEELQTLKRLHKSAILYCIVVFGQSGESHNERVIFNGTNTETVMCDITRLFLDELTGYLASFQHITLRSPGTIGGNEKAAVMPVKNKRISSGSAIGLSLSGDLANTKISIKTANERRQSRIKGRQLKILGNLLLIAGQYADALREFQDALKLLKAGNDYLWLGSTLEGVAVAIIMLCFLDTPYQLTPSLANMLHSSATLNYSLTSPTSTPISSPRSSMVSGSVDLERYTAPELIHQISTRMVHFYELSQNDPEDYVPKLVYCESILRFLKLMTVVNLGGGLNNNTLNHIVRGNPFIINDDMYIFDKMDILKVSNKIMTVQFKSMDILSQTKIFGSLASIYGDLGFDRKKSFMLRTLFVCLIPQLKSQDSNTSGYDLHDMLNTLLSVYGVSSSTESNILDAFSPKWVQLQRSVIKLCMSVCEGIRDYETVICLKTLLLTRFVDSLTDNEQIKIFNEIQQISKEHSIAAPYFDPFVVRGINLVKLSNSPRKQKKIPTSITNHPVLYNPYTKAAVVDTNYVVQGEFAEFLLDIQNPYAFPIAINDIKIPGLEIFRNHYTINPRSVSRINIITKPLKAGKLIIGSVELKICELKAQNFKIAKSEKCEVIQKLKPSNVSSPEILKAFQTNISENSILGRVQTDLFEVEVITAQPNLQILSNPEPLMLLEGGQQQLEIKLINNSDVSVNVFNCSIWDSTIDPLKKMLENKDQSAADIYECEYFLYKNSLKILTEIDQIKASEEVSLLVQVQGKRGISKIKLAIDYGHSDEAGIQFTRNLDIPITAIVHQSIDLADCDFVPLIQQVPPEKSSIGEYLSKSGGGLSDYVLALIDVRNVWNKAFTVDVENLGYEIHEFIVPMQTKRLVIPMKRMDLDYESLDPIPSFSGKRYIRQKLSKLEEQFQKESFWYREELLKNLKGTWTCGDSSGNIEFRGIRLTQKMISLLREDKIIVSANIEGPTTKKGRYQCVTTGEFFCICVTIENRTKRPLRGSIRNVPSTTSYGSIGRKILYNGILQQSLDHSLQPGESWTSRLGAVVLERGDYEWGSIFDESDNEMQHITRTPLWIKAI